MPRHQGWTFHSGHHRFPATRTGERRTRIQQSSRQGFDRPPPAESGRSPRKDALSSKVNSQTFNASSASTTGDCAPRSAAAGVPTRPPRGRRGRLQHRALRLSRKLYRVPLGGASSQLGSHTALTDQADTLGPQGSDLELCDSTAPTGLRWTVFTTCARWCPRRARSPGPGRLPARQSGIAGCSAVSRSPGRPSHLRRSPTEPGRPYRLRPFAFTDDGLGYGNSRNASAEDTAGGITGSRRSGSTTLGGVRAGRRRRGR